MQEGRSLSLCGRRTQRLRDDRRPRARALCGPPERARGVPAFVGSERRAPARRSFSTGADSQPEQQPVTPDFTTPVNVAAKLARPARKPARAASLGGSGRAGPADRSEDLVQST